MPKKIYADKWRVAIRFKLFVKWRNTHTLQSNKSAIMSVGRALRDIQKTAARGIRVSPSPTTKQKDNLMIFMGVKPRSVTWLLATLTVSWVRCWRLERPC